MSRVVVVGSGIAGLTAALEASRLHAVTLVTKAALTEANTRYAQGGIAAAVFPDDSAEAHAADTERAGAGLTVPEAVAALCGDGPDRIRDLLALGTRFDTVDGPGAGDGGDGIDGLARGLEAAHSAPRVLHAGGDATGAEIERALVEAVRASGVRVVERAFLLDVLVTDGAAAGVRLLLADGSTTSLAADAVILATGGFGRLWSRTTNPEVATGDGIAAAWRAGAALADLEFTQFHPTALALPGSFLVSEAVRGEGAVLRNAHGERFMLDVHPDAELAPRDVVARGIAVEMAAQGGAPVVLDATALGRDFLSRRFPTIDAASRAAGLDWATEPVPVTPAAHYAMGGVATDTSGRSTLPGLFAAGEVACTGVHGANRLASNSLLEGLVFAHRAVAALGEEWPPPPAWITAARPADLPIVDAHPSLAFDRSRLGALMWEAAGVHRSGTGLRAAAAELAATAMPLPGEDANLLQLARLVVAAALAREESRGAHFRADHPLPAPGTAQHTLIAGASSTPLSTADTALRTAEVTAAC
ncbi:L-aspartate oxidase [Leifsonia sp. F6_8S_P_1B]|uniref:L-aspartate oxidase n=1 Tax=Leifsonia williamsii TaxID=3035919 RepID=A0ABT8KE60_9MICO|nr:L-aspartate oxidase [Leifsonia williamsii]MDN4615754.1 L-aspartate oxidase [Leifsonia williamsii]